MGPSPPRLPMALYANDSPPTPTTTARLPATIRRRRWPRARAACRRSIAFASSSARALSRSSRSRRSSIVGLLEGAAQVGASLLRESSNGDVAHAHRPARFDRAVAVQLREDQRLSPARRELGERSGQRVAFVGGGEQVRAVRVADHPPRSPHRPTGPAPVAVQGGPVEVPGRIVHACHPIPAFPQREEGVLKDLLGLFGVAAQQVERAQQTQALGLEELLEGSRGRHWDRRRRSIHRAMNARSIVSVHRRRQQAPSRSGFRGANGYARTAMLMSANRYKVLTVRGVPIYLGSSWFWVAGLYAFLQYSRFSESAWNPTQGTILGGTLLSTVLFFGGVLLHESAHAVVARSFGL